MLLLLFPLFLPGPLLLGRVVGVGLCCVVLGLNGMMMIGVLDVTDSLGRREGACWPKQLKSTWWKIDMEQIQHLDCKVSSSKY